MVFRKKDGSNHRSENAKKKKKKQVSEKSRMYRLLVDEEDSKEGSDSLGDIDWEEDIEVDTPCLDEFAPPARTTTSTEVSSKAAAGTAVEVPETVSLTSDPTVSAAVAAVDLISGSGDNQFEETNDDFFTPEDRVIVRDIVTNEWVGGCVKEVDGEGLEVLVALDLPGRDLEWVAVDKERIRPAGEGNMPGAFPTSLDQGEVAERIGSIGSVIAANSNSKTSSRRSTTQSVSPKSKIVIPTKKRKRRGFTFSLLPKKSNISSLSSTIPARNRVKTAKGAGYEISKNTNRRMPIWKTDKSAVSATAVKMNKKSKFKEGEKILAKWSDHRMQKFPAVIKKVSGIGQYDVLFYDGFEKTILEENIFKCSLEEEEKYKHAKPSEADFLIEEEILNKAERRQKKRKTFDGYLSEKDFKRKRRPPEAVPSIHPVVLPPVPRSRKRKSDLLNSPPPLPAHADPVKAKEETGSCSPIIDERPTEVSIPQKEASADINIVQPTTPVSVSVDKHLVLKHYPLSITCHDGVIRKTIIVEDSTISDGWSKHLISWVGKSYSSFLFSPDGYAVHSQAELDKYRFKAGNNKDVSKGQPVPNDLKSQPLENPAPTVIPEIPVLPESVSAKPEVYDLLSPCKEEQKNDILIPEEKIKKEPIDKVKLTAENVDVSEEIRVKEENDSHLARTKDTPSSADNSDIATGVSIPAPGAQLPAACSADLVAGQPTSYLVDFSVPSAEVIDRLLIEQASWPPRGRYRKWINKVLDEKRKASKKIRILPPSRSFPTKRVRTLLPKHRQQLQGMGKGIDPGKTWRCPKESCGKKFRKENLLQMHIKHYHAELSKGREGPKVVDLAVARSVDSVYSGQIGTSRALSYPSPLRLSTLGEHHENTDERHTPSPRRNVQQEESDSAISVQAEERKPTIKTLLPRPPAKTPPGPSSAPSTGVGIPGGVSVKTEPQPSASRESDSEMQSEPKHLVRDASKDGVCSSTKVTTLKRRHHHHHQFHGHHEKLAGVSPLDSNESFRGSPAPEVTEDGLVIERLKSEEIINCSCGLREEDGLMVQCEICLCWQHGACTGIERDSDVPDRYVCHTCRNPLRVRSTHKFHYARQYLTQAKLPRFSLRTCKEDILKQRERWLARSFELSASLRQLHRIETSLSTKINIAQETDHPKLYLWSTSWDESKTEQCSDAVERIKTDNGGAREGIVGGAGPVGEAPIESEDCRLRLLDHIEYYQQQMDARLSYLLGHIISSENEDSDLTSEESCTDHHPLLKQAVYMMMRDLTTLRTAITLS